MTDPLVIHLDDLRGAMVHLEPCPDCVSTVLVVVDGREWNAVVGHCVPCPVTSRGGTLAATAV